MMMTWISDKAVKWILYILAPLIVIGLLFMGMTGLTTQKEPSVGIVNGVKLNNAEFKNVLKSNERQNSQRGVRLTDKQLAQSRRNIFDQMVISQLLKDKVEENNIRASVFEMKRELMENPHPSFKSSPEFQTDSVFDINKYQAWLENDSVYDLPGMDQLEVDIRDNRVPMNQLQLFVSAKAHTSDLEKAFEVKSRDNKYSIEYLSTSLDSFDVTAKDVSDDEIKQYFEAHPDSFYVTEDKVAFNYVSVKVEASAFDENNAQLHTQWILDQIKSGSTDFAQMAKTNSEDLASAPQGGALGDYTGKDQWVKEFADAAFALKAGEISAPVKTEYGYHLILSHGKKMVKGEELAQLSHILVKVTPGPETIDSLRQLLEDSRNKVIEGASLSEVAADKKMAVISSDFIKRGDSIPSLGYLVGLSDFGFVERDNKETVSRVLQNPNTMAVFEIANTIKKGTRSLDFFKSAIQSSVIQEKKVAAATAYLTQQLEQIKSGEVDSARVAKLSNVTYDRADNVTAFGFIPKISYGYGSAVVSHIVSQKINTWGGVRQGMGYVVVARVISKNELSEAEVAEKVKTEKSGALNKYSMQNSFNTWAMNLKAMAEIEDNLDLFYAE